MMISIFKDPSAWAVTALIAGATLLPAQTPQPPAAPAAPAPPAQHSSSSSASNSRTRQVFINQVGGGASYLGVGLAEVDSERARQLKLKEEYGVEVTRVDDESPAAKAGLKSGDVVLEYNGQRVEGFEQFARFVRETPVGREVKLTISREGARQMLMVKVGARSGRSFATAMPPMPPVAPVAPVPPAARAMEFPRPFMVWTTTRLGISAEGIDGQLGQFFGVKEGVLIRAVTAGSSAEKAGLRAGDVITKVDGSAAVTPSDVTRAIRSAHTKKSVVLTVVRDKKEMSVTAAIEGEDRSGKEHFFFRDDAGGTAGWTDENFKFFINGQEFKGDDLKNLKDFNFHFEFPSNWDGNPRTIRTIKM